MRKHLGKSARRFSALTMAAVMVLGMPAVNVAAPSMINVKAAVQTTSTKTESQKLEDIFTTIDLMDATVSSLEKEMSAGNLTAKQLVQMYIDRINKYDKSLDLNSIISINPDAVKEAEQKDKDRAAGKAKGKLFGIPVVVKDNYDVKGMPTTAGCLSLENSIAPEDSYVVKKLKEEGAIILAKANMSEFASSGSNSRSTIGGTVHNAYDTSRTAAGSSGGTAVAVTANFATVGFGTDTGSSIRRPSSFSNLYGIRPSKGLTSISGVVPLIAARDVTGPICRTAEDMALMLETIAGTDTKDEYTVEADANSLKGEGYTSKLSENSLKGKKIGFLQNSIGYNVASDGTALESGRSVSMDSKVSGMVTKTLATLKKGGADIVNLDKIIPESLYTELRSSVPYADTGEYDLNKYFTELGDSAPYKTVADLIKTGYGVGYSNLYSDGTQTSFEDMENPYETEQYKKMWTAMKNFRTKISDILKENGIDAVLYVSQTDVCDKEESSNNHNNEASYINNFGPVAGLPDMMIPMGMSKTDESNGYDHALPLGMSMFSSYGNEATLMQIAYGYEQQAGESIRQQPYTTPALEDKNVDNFLDDLMDKVYSIDYSKYTVYPTAKIKKMETKYDVAAVTDTSDVYKTYKATKDLATAYDNVMNALSGHEKNTSTATATTGTKTVTVKAPAKVKIKSAKRTSAKKAKIKINKVTGASGYQISYSTSKKYTKKATTTLKTRKTTYTLKKLKNKKYYVKVRAYKLSGNKTVYGKWSATKTIKK